MRIPVETKHTYLTYEAIIKGNISGTEIPQTLGNFRVAEPYYPVQGTDENNRVGRKITTEFISEEGIISLCDFTAENDLLDYWNGYLQDQVAKLQPDNYEYPVNNLSFTIPIRHMVVEFQDEEMYNSTPQQQSLYLADWYKQLVIQTFENTGINPSVLTDTKRESTPYTGRFKILLDDKYYLDTSKKAIHFKYKLPIKKTVNFEAAGSDPSNLHIFSVWIGPLNPYVDYFNRGFGVFMIDTAEIIVPPTVAFVNSTMKLSYVDL